MKMDAPLSWKLKVLSFISIVMVVYIHTYYTEGETFATLGLAERWIGGKTCRIAVPLFYAISGYLFFLKMPDGIRSIASKLKKRVRTLLVPYALANTFTLLFYVAVNLVARKVPAVDAVLNFKVLDTVSKGVWPTLEMTYITPPLRFNYGSCATLSL